MADDLINNPRAYLLMEDTFEDFNALFKANSESQSLWQQAESFRTQYPDNDYFVIAENSLTNQTQEVSDMKQFRDVFIKNFSGSSKTFRALFGLDELTPEEKDNVVDGGPIRLSLYTVRGGRQGKKAIVPYRFLHKGVWATTWGMFGEDGNCVISQIGERITYWTALGEKRVGMWNEDGTKKSMDSEMANRIRVNKELRAMRNALDNFKKSREFDPAVRGLDMRDLNDLAECLNCRIMVWTPSRAVPLQRWDTDSYVPAKDSNNGDRRYIFAFYMTSTRHLEMIEDEKNEELVWNPRALRDYRPKDLVLNYVDDSFFEKLFDGQLEENGSPKVYVIVRDAPKWPIPAYIRNETKYGGLLIREGANLYKHEAYRKFVTDELGLDPSTTDDRMIMSYADLHYDDLKAAYRQCHVRPINQRHKPALFAAARYADKIVGHTMHPVDVGTSIWDTDGRKWYLTNFSEVVDFPYFHGYPFQCQFQEYSGVRRDTIFENGACTTRVSMIGNMFDYDRPFTFAYSKYAIFIIESFDFSSCSSTFMEHIRRDKLFVDMNTEHFVCILASPIVHFLQDNGVKWRASHLWVTYGCHTDWIPHKGGQWAENLRKEMEKHKSYPICMGKLMSGRDPIVTSKYIVKDRDTAIDLVEMNCTVYTDKGIGTGVSKNGVQRNVNPDSFIYTESNEVYGTCGITRPTYQRGGYYTRKNASNGYEDESAPFFVTSVTDLWGYGSSMCHISGAQHAYAFVRLYQACIELEPQHVVGFSLDSIKTTIDPSEILKKYIGDKHGYFKAPVKNLATARVCCNPALLSDMFTQRAALGGMSKPDTDKPLWGPYQDKICRFNIVTGPAGSGKTTRHFIKFDNDDRLDTSTVCYATLTNYLTAKMRKDLAPGMAMTSYKAFNRRVDDEGHFALAHKRYDDKVTFTSGVKERNELSMKCGTVFLDEVTMQDSSKIKDAVEVAWYHHMQIFLVGDFDETQFFQLQTINNGGEDMLQLFIQQLLALERELFAPLKWQWTRLTEVVRQQNDRELKELLQYLRTPGDDDLGEQWQKVKRCGLFRVMQYQDALAEFDSTKDLFVCPCHDNITAITEDVWGRMKDTDVLQVRGNFPCPYKVKPADPDIIKQLAPFEGDPHAYKGAVTLVTKSALSSIRNSGFMKAGFPYYMSEKRSGNMINPMIGTTAFTLQGLTLDPGATLFVHSNKSYGSDWLNCTQPKALYVALSRARVRDQIVLVIGDSQAFKRQRTV